MKILRVLLWVVALVPAGAAILWSSLASRFPESMLSHRALGECLPQWDFQMLTTLDSEPAHLLTRLVQMSLLHIPGMTIQWTAMANALLAILLAMALARLVRRDLVANELGRPVIFLAAALLACNPAYGANWLHGERVGRFAVPLLFVYALLLLGPGRRFGYRAFFATLLAIIAPLFHDRGAFVFLALVPAMLVPGRMASVIMLLVLGNIAAVASFYPAGQFHLAESGVFGALLSSPTAMLDELLRTTGELWPDLLRHRTIDERALGLLSWLSPLMLLLPRRAGSAVSAEPDDSAPPAQSPDGIWWSCVAFGLLSVVFHYERHGMDFLAAQPLLPQIDAELLYGGFLLPVGVLGVVASRFGASVWPLAGGVLLVLTAQSWDHGVDALRFARTGVDRDEVIALLPEAMAGPRENRDLPTRDVSELLLLEERGWVPTADAQWIPVIEGAVAAEPDPASGTFEGGSATVQTGTVISSVLTGQIGCVLINASEAGEDFRVIANTAITPDLDSKALPWRVKLGSKLNEGTRVRAIGIDVRGREGVRLGPTFVVKDGVLVQGDQ